MMRAADARLSASIMISSSTRFWSTGIAGGLHDKDVDAANVLEQLEVDFAIGEALELGLAQRNADVAADLLSQRPVGRCR